MSYVTQEDVKAHIIQSSMSNKILELIILPTEKCNFRCVYCYEDFAIGRMSVSVIDGVIGLINARAPDLEHLSINWFGGEPLLAKDIIYKIMSEAQNLSKSYGFKLWCSVTTNGFLLSTELLKYLDNSDACNYQISLDGTEEVHNTTRVSRSGDSFRTIWNNLILICDLTKKKVITNTSVSLRLHIHKSNVGSVIELAKNIREELDMEVVKPFVKEIGNLSDKEKHGLDTFKHNSAELIEAKSSIYRVLHGSVNSKSSIKTNEFGVEVCYAGKANSFVIRANGNIGKCTVALGDDRNNVGTLNGDGTMTIVPKKFLPWLHSLGSMNIADLGCPIEKLSSI